MVHSQKSVLFRSTIPSVIIIVFMMLVLQQFDIYKQNQSQELTDNFKQIVDSLLEKRVTNIQTMANSVSGFYLGSENVEDHEFDAFARKILEANTDVTNLFVLDGQKTIQSYPYSEFRDNILEEVLPGFPVVIDNQETMLLEFPIQENTIFVIGIPFDYFMSENFLGYDSIKIKLHDPVSSGVLYQYDSSKQDPHIDVVFTDTEIEQAVLINKQTTLLGHKIQQHYTLEYLIWTDELIPKLGIVEIVMVSFGVIFAIVLFVLLYRSLILQQNLQTKTQQLQKSNQELEEAIRARNEFATMISHELKTPLTPIKGFCKLLTSQKIGPLNKKQLDYLNEIQTNTDQLQGLIDDLLVVRKLDMDRMTFQITDIDVSLFLNSIHENWKMLTGEKNIDFVVEKKEGICVTADEQKLRQVFSNLIKNAVDFVAQDTGQIRIGVDSDDSYVTFYVKDNGIGISEENQEKLFQKFYQVDVSVTRKHGGTGLGLSICKGLIKGMKGDMWVKSELGQGTIFYFKLPSCHNKNNSES